MKGNSGLKPGIGVVSCMTQPRFGGQSQAPEGSAMGDPGRSNDLLRRRPSRSRKLYRIYIT
jgi:hypothetical protein